MRIGQIVVKGRVSIRSRSKRGLFPTINLHSIVITKWGKKVANSQPRSEVFQMSRYYTKNASSPVNRTQYIGAQMAERERVSRERSGKTTQSLREKKGWKCDECGIVLKNNPKMLHKHYSRIMCLGCAAEQPGKKHLKQKGRRPYKRFIGQYGKEWHRRRKELDRM